MEGQSDAVVHVNPPDHEAEQSSDDDRDSVEFGFIDDENPGLSNHSMKSNYCTLYPQTSDFDNSKEHRKTRWVNKHFAKYPVRLKDRHLKTLRKVCRKGLPSADRNKLWYLIVSRLSVAPEQCDVATLTCDYDQSLLDICHTHLTVNPNPKWSDLILRDLRRCLPDDQNFNHFEGLGYKALNKVLFAFSVHNKDVGYCQGLGPLVAFILKILNSQTPEDYDWTWEESFWILHFLNHESHFMRDYNTPGLQGVIVDLWLFGELVRRYLRKQYKILNECGYEPTLYAQAWFFCLYVRTLPDELCVRIWDMYLCEGKFVMFQVGLLIMATVYERCKEAIKAGNHEEFLHYLQHPEHSWFKSDSFMKKLVGFKIHKKTRRKYLELADQYRYSTFGETHTVESVVHRNRVSPSELGATDFETASEVSVDSSMFGETTLLHECPSPIQDLARRGQEQDLQEETTSVSMDRGSPVTLSACSTTSEHKEFTLKS